MNAKQKADCKALIEYYEQRGQDWSDALEFQVRSYNHSLPKDEWPLLIRPQKAGRPRKTRLPL